VTRSPEAVAAKRRRVGRATPVFPTFIVIGAPKAGTTSLYHYLRSHPDVFMPKRKELEYFSFERNWRRGFEWYLNHFARGGGASAVGEVSPAYSTYPSFVGVPQRIASLIPDVRLVYLVRHPLERMRSHYQQRYISGVERRPIAEALWDPFYIDCSSYSFQIEQYLEYFPRERLLVVTLDRLSAHGQAAMADVYRFLGVDSDFSSPALQERWNVSAGRLVRRDTLRRLRRLPGASRVAAVLPEVVKWPARRLTHQTAALPDTRLPKDLERELTAHFEDDVRRLSGFVCGAFDGWGIA
jgi:Sulfotransferase domain